jgi:two-component system nitrate/nitrite response regulator NarL
LAGSEGTLTTRIFIAVRVRLYREGLAEILGREQQIDVIGLAGDAADTVMGVRELKPDVVLVDPAISDDMDVIRELAEKTAGATIVVIASSETDAELIACAEAGVAGFVSREDSVGNLVATLRSAEAGELLCSPGTAGSFLRHIRALASGRTSSASELTLTAREVEVARLLDEGLSNKQIALRLCIELPTVKHHVHHILEKLGVGRRSEAVARLRQQGLLRTTSAS